jgi:hypothetical protein
MSGYELLLHALGTESEPRNITKMLPFVYP